VTFGSVRLQPSFDEAQDGPEDLEGPDHAANRTGLGPPEGGHYMRNVSPQATGDTD